MKNLITLERIAIVILAIALFFAINKCKNSDRDKEVITIPEYHKTTDTIYLNKVTEKKVYLKGRTITVDSTDYSNYNKTNDTVTKKEMFIDAITINKYDTIIEDNDRIKIKLHAKTKGELLSVNTDYTIKEKTIDIKKPTSILIGVVTNTKGTLSLQPGLQLRNGDIIFGSINTDKSFSLGFTRKLIEFK